MRLFVSIQLSEDMRAAICNVETAMQRQGVRGNYTPRENLHLTLAFIGEYNAPDQVLEVISSIPFEPFELKLQGLDCFGDLWWIGLEPSSRLQSYVRQLRHALAEAGIPFDRKRFTPHITVLRRASMDLAKLSPPWIERTGMIADHATLMRSDRGKRGMIYTEIH